MHAAVVVVLYSVVSWIATAAALDGSHHQTAPIGGPAAFPTPFVMPWMCLEYCSDGTPGDIPAQLASLQQALTAGHINAVSYEHFTVGDGGTLVAPSALTDITARHTYGTWRYQKGWKPLHVTKAEGVYFWDATGKRYLYRIRMAPLRSPRRSRSIPILLWTKGFPGSVLRTRL